MIYFEVLHYLKAYLIFASPTGMQPDSENAVGSIPSIDCLVSVAISVYWTTFV